MSFGLLVPVEAAGNATRLALAERAAHALRTGERDDFAALAVAARRYADCAAPHDSHLRWRFANAPFEIDGAASEPFAIDVPADAERAAALFLAAAAAASAAALHDALTYTTRAAECVRARDTTLPSGPTGRPFVCAPHFYEHVVAAVLFAKLMRDATSDGLLAALRANERARLLNEAARQAPYNLCPTAVRTALRCAARDAQSEALRRASRRMFERATLTTDARRFAAADALCAGAVRAAHTSALREEAEVQRDAHRAVCDALDVGERFFCGGRAPQIDARCAGAPMRAPFLARATADTLRSAQLDYDAAAVTLRVRCNAPH